MIQHIVNKAYEDFTTYKATAPLDVCTECCMKPEEATRLAGMPVREIPAELLMAYNDGAKPEKTDVEEMKHFLPRYLELISVYDFPTHSAELTLGRLHPFDRSEWTDEEYKLLNKFAIAFFMQCLSVYPLPSFNDRIDTMLIMYYRGGLSIDPLLDAWGKSDNPEAVLHFSDLYYEGFDPHNRNRMFSGFADETLAAKLNRWMESDSVRQAFSEKIEKFILSERQDDEDKLNRLNILYDIIRPANKQTI